MLEKKPIPNERLKHQRELRGWSQAKLAEKIGITPVSISRWETGATSPDPYFREKLCKLFKKDAYELGFIAEENGVDPTEFQEADAEHAEREPGDSDTNEGQNGLWPSTIPNEYYYPLPGREQDLKQLLAVLQNPQGAPVVVIEGLGGLGKTALAAELSKRALRERLFKGVVGESAKLEDFSGGEIVTVREATLDFDLLLDSIARQLGHWEIPTLKAEEKQAILGRLLRQHSYLVFLDNLETSENANALVARLRAFLGNSRAIVTSRKQVRQDFVQRLSLRGLELADSLVFLEMDMRQRGVQQSLDLPKEKLVEIHEVTGGAPLAMKLVIAQASFLDLDLVLKQMRSASSDGLYTFIFRRSWEGLSPVAQ